MKHLRSICRLALAAALGLGGAGRPAVWAEDGPPPGDPALPSPQSPNGGGYLGTPPGCVPAIDFFTNSTDFPIPDNGTVTSTITVTTLSAHPYLWDIDVTTFIQHTAGGDLDIYLVSPSGITVTLTTDNGGDFDNTFDGTIWDDQGGENNPPGGPDFMPPPPDR